MLRKGSFTVATIRQSDKTFRVWFLLLLPSVTLHFNMMQMSTYFWLGRQADWAGGPFVQLGVHTQLKEWPCLVEVTSDNSTSSHHDGSNPICTWWTLPHLTTLLGTVSQLHLSTEHQQGGNILNDSQPLMQSHTYGAPIEPVKPSQLWSFIPNTG